jgi:hypothetical protein
MLQLIYTVICIFFLIIGWFAGNSFTKNNSSPKLPFPITYDYKKDTEFLYFIMEFYLDNAINRIIYPLDESIGNIFLLDNTTVNQIIEDTILEINSCLNPTYRASLMRYFTEESLTNFITENVMLSIQKVVLDRSKKKINGFIK